MILSFHFRILSSFSLQDRREWDSCREMKKDKEVKTLQNGSKQESQSCTGSRILREASEVPWEVVLCDLIFFFSSGAMLRYSAPAATEWSGLLLEQLLHSNSKNIKFKKNVFKKMTKERNDHQELTSFTLG